MNDGWGGFTLYSSPGSNFQLTKSLEYSRALRFESGEGDLFSLIIGLIPVSEL